MKVEEMQKLKAPFPAEDIEWRLQSCGEKNGKFWGKALAYITSRAVQERFDDVCGPDGWQTSIKKEGDAYLCTLSVRIEHDDGTTEWISRTDGADSTDIEAVKGGISGSIKRAAVLFGCGRYLYNLKESWANVCDNGIFNGKTKEGKWFKWNPPTLPAWALPKEAAKEQIRTEAKAEIDTKTYEDVKGKLIEFMDSGIMNEEEVATAKKAIDNKSIMMMQKILACCVNRNAQKQGA